MNGSEEMIFQIEDTNEASMILNVAATLNIKEYLDANSEYYLSVTFTAIDDSETFTKDIKMNQLDEEKEETSDENLTDEDQEDEKQEDDGIEDESERPEEEDSLENDSFSQEESLEDINDDTVHEDRLEEECQYEIATFFTKEVIFDKRYV